MDHFANQIEGLREKMLAQHTAELRTLAGLDQALLADDVALRDELRGIRQRHETRRGDIRAELESFAASLGMLPAPRQAQAVPLPAELPTVDQALTALERRPQIAPVPGQNYQAAPAVHAVPPRYDAEPLPRIVRNMAGG